MNIGQVLETHLGWIAKTGWEVEGTPEWAAKLPEELYSVPQAPTPPPRSSTAPRKTR